MDTAKVTQLPHQAVQAGIYLAAVSTPSRRRDMAKLDTRLMQVFNGSLLSMVNYDFSAQVTSFYMLFI